MKFYIASKLENAERVKELAGILKGWGWQHTYDWTTHGSVKNEGEGRIQEVAQNEIDGVKDADFVIVLLPGGRGTHAELGAANVLEKHVFVWGESEEYFILDDRTCSFYWNKNVTQIKGDLMHLVGEIARIGFWAKNDMRKTL